MCCDAINRKPIPSSPGATVSVEYKTEYSVDKIEMHIGAVKEGQRVLLVDDLIATGGTLGEVVLRGKSVGVASVACDGAVKTLIVVDKCQRLSCPHGPCPVAGAELVRKVGAIPVEAACVIELPELEGRSKLDGLPLFVLVEKAGI